MEWTAVGGLLGRAGGAVLGWISAMKKHRPEIILEARQGDDCVNLKLTVRNRSPDTLVIVAVELVDPKRADIHADNGPPIHVIGDSRPRPVRSARKLEIDMLLPPYAPGAAEFPSWSEFFWVNALGPELRGHISTKVWFSGSNMTLMERTSSMLRRSDTSYSRWLSCSMASASIRKPRT